MKEGVNNNLDLLEVKAGLRISFVTGEIEAGHPCYMSTRQFYRAGKGSRLHLISNEYLYSVAAYTLERPLAYIYTYAYQKEENWSCYNMDLSMESFCHKDYIFDEEVYFRVSIKRTDNQSISDAEALNINRILEFSNIVCGYEEKSFYKDEIRLTADSVNKKRKDDSLVFILLTDSHYTVNGTWEDTAYNIKALHKEIKSDAIIHLGDFTDGMTGAGLTKKYADITINSLLENNVPVYFTVGNHDSNYFRANPERLTKKAQQDIYLKSITDNIKLSSNQLYYYVDFDKARVRGIFLDSYNYEESVKYGFSSEELEWLKKILNSTPEGYSVILFSHVPPLACLHYWSDTIRNEDKLMEILETFNMTAGRQILAFIHGHNHADQIYYKRSFPIIAIGCSKCEYFTDKKPEGSFTYTRTLDTVTQELWDVLVVNPGENKIELIRFGAGADRTIILNTK